MKLTIHEFNNTLYIKAENLDEILSHQVEKCLEAFKENHWNEDTEEKILNSKLIITDFWIKDSFIEMLFKKFKIKR